MSNDAPPAPLPGCSTCQGILIEQAKLTQGNAEGAQPVQATGQPRPSDLAAPVRTLWPNGQVFKVWFLNGTDYQDHVALIKATVPEWERYANVSFTFPEQWDEESPPEVRILFANDGYWSYLGLDVRTMGERDTKPNPENPTMSLYPDNLSSEYRKVSYRGTVLHEFGHTLGFMHEHQRPDGGLKIPYDMSKIYDWYKENVDWDVQTVNQQVLNFEAYRGQQIAANAFDTKSIMMYSISSAILLPGTPPIPRNNVLSDGDKEFVARLYPRDTDQRPAIQPGELIRS